MTKKKRFKLTTTQEEISYVCHNCYLDDPCCSICDTDLVEDEYYCNAIKRKRRWK